MTKLMKKRLAFFPIGRIAGRSLGNGRIPPLLAIRDRLHELLAPIQKDSADKETTGVCSLNRARKNRTHDKRENKQRKNMSPNKFGCLHNLNQNAFWHADDCLLHTLFLSLEHRLIANGSIVFNKNKGIALEKKRKTSERIEK